MGDRDDLMIVRIEDVSFKTEEKAVGGVFLFITNLEMTKEAPIFRKSKQI